MLTRTLAIMAAALLAVPTVYAEVEGEGPGVRGDRPAGEHKPDLGERPEAGNLFAKFDHDSNGSVSKPEFGHGLRAMMEKRMEGGGDRPRPPEGGGDRPRPPEGGGDRPRPPEGGDDKDKAMRERAEKAFKAGDANNDGALSQEEFRAAMGALGGGQPPKKPAK